MQIEHSEDTLWSTQHCFSYEMKKNMTSNYFLTLLLPMNFKGGDNFISIFEHTMSQRCTKQIRKLITKREMTDNKLSSSGKS